MSARALAAAALAVGTLLGCGGWPSLSLAADSVVFRHHVNDPLATDRIIVKWRRSGVAAVQMDSVQQRTARLSSANGITLQSGRNLFDRTDLMRLDHQPGHAEMQSILARLNTDPAVEYAEPDELRFLADFPADLPNDPHFLASTDPSNASNSDLNFGSWEGQWYLLPSSATTPAAISATTAWQSTLGSANVVVAVLDTGIIEDHPDFAGKLLPGYDFVSCDEGNDTTATANTTLADCGATGSAATYAFANDGHGWDADPSDPGDWIDASDAASAVFVNAGCTTTAPSSWHGTKVAGIIGALTNNGVGIAGVAPLTMLLPVRVVGKCEARVSDIAAAIHWAAGIAVSIDGGLTIAASPIANIINLSLAANSACSSTEQDAINDAIAAGVLIVAAAGNEGGPLDAPANCSGVLSVVGLRHTGTKVPYSSLSSSAAAASIAAPGGNCVNTATTQPCLYGIDTTTDAGTTTPSSTPGFYTYALLNQSYLNQGANTENAAVVGTSFAAPMVSGVAALMLAVNPSLTPSQLIARMQSSALAFPTSSSTTSTTCQLPATTIDANSHFTDVSQNIECVCTTATCGAGMLNAQSALLTAEGMFVQITASSTTGTPGKKITLDGSASTPATGQTITTYSWTTNPATSDQLLNANTAVATLIVPSFRSIQVILTITDSAGNTLSGSTTILSSFNTSGGSGALQPWLLLLLAAVAGWQLRCRFLN